jgi:anaerobic dimethyl sulfoxide reductase subunit A
VPSDTAERIIPSGCAHDCMGHCILKAHVRDGVIVRITSDDDGPDTPGERQLRACSRGRAYRQRVYHPDRLLHPLVRTGERGSGQFREASWGEALDTAAAGIRRVWEAHGNEALFPLFGTGFQGLLRGDACARRLLGLLGGYLGTYGSYSNGAASAASLATYGVRETGNSFDDFVNSRLIVLWGHNLADTFTGTGAPRFLAQAKERGARVVYIDPIYTDTAILADEWIPIYPGTDAALAAALAYVMIEENLLDREFLDSYCVGFDDARLPTGSPAGSSYESYVLGRSDGEPKSPAWASAITGVPVESIVRLAREYATTKPAALLQGWGGQRAAYGEQFSRAGMVLAAMTGNVGISGGSASGGGSAARSMRLVGLPTNNAVRAQIPVYRWTDAIERGTELTPADGLRGADRLASNVKLILALQGNVLVNQHGDINRTKRLLADTSRVEFILVADQFLTPSARFADVVLPAVTWFERDDVMGGANGSEYAVFLNKAIEPLGDARGDYAMVAGIADRLGLGAEFSEGRDEEGWLRHLVGLSGIPDFDEFRRTGIQRRVWPEPHVAFADFRRDPAANPLATPSGKIEVYSTDAAAQGDDRGVPAVPRYQPPWEGRDDPLRERFPLQLLTPHPKHRTHSIFGNLPWIREISVEGVHLNPVDAAPRGIASGDLVRVFNDRGTALVTAHLTERIMPGVAVVYQGMYYRPRADGVDEGGNANVLTSQRPSAWIKGSTTHTSLVEIERESAVSKSVEAGA